jgi:hypothetical protein
MENSKYLPAPLTSTELFAKMNFSERQLTAIRSIFQKYFNPVTRGFKYVGNAISVDWTSVDPIGSTYNDAFSNKDQINGYRFKEDVNADPLWNEFKDLLPYMNKNGSITVMPPMSVMVPHIDRPNRPMAVYFPISGCTVDCFSDFYHLPKNKDPNVRNWTHESVSALYSYNVIDNAYIMNTQEWHGVRNYSRLTRIAFGWNFLAGPKQKTFAELREILTSLGYIKEN